MYPWLECSLFFPLDIFTLSPFQLKCGLLMAWSAFLVFIGFSCSLNNEFFSVHVSFFCTTQALIWERTTWVKCGINALQEWVNGALSVCRKNTKEGWVEDRKIINALVYGSQRISGSPSPFQIKLPFFYLDDSNSQFKVMQSVLVEVISHKQVTMSCHQMCCPFVTNL